MSSTHNLLHARNEHGWRKGFSNLWKQESRLWWGTSQWIIHIIIWTLIVDGIYSLIVLALSHAPASASAPEPGLSATGFGLFLFSSLALIFTGLGAIILAQSKIIGERENGTAEWVLSKPVSRVAFVVSRCGVLPGMIVSMVLIPILVAMVITFFATHAIPSLTTFFVILAWLVSSLWGFYCLTLMFGTLFKSRAVTIGLAFVLLIGLYQLVMSTLKVGVEIMRHIINGELTLPLLIISITLLAGVLFLGVAIQRFRKEDF